jgi:cold shock CspA family protein
VLRRPFPTNVRQFQHQFATEEACQEYLGRLSLARGLRMPAGSEKPFYPRPPPANRPRATKRPGALGLPEPRTGRPMTGRIVRIMPGHGQGYIRLEDDRDVFFDRRDLVRVVLYDLEIGDLVAFELIDDRVSGPRATQVRKRRGK